MLTVLSSQEEVGISLGLEAPRDSFTKDPMVYAPTQRLSLAEKTPLPLFLLAPNGWANNLLRITHTLLEICTHAQRHSHKLQLNINQ
jgi:hypothetical protein